MQSWAINYNSQHCDIDALSLLAAAVVNLSCFVKLTFDINNSGTWFILLGAVHHLLLFYLICGRWEFFIQWRATILGVHLVIRSFEYHFLAANTPEFILMHPLEMPQGDIVKVASHVLFITMTLLYNALSYMFSIRTYKIISGYGFVVFSLQTFQRCSQEVVGVPNQGQRYRAMALFLESLISKGFIPPITYPSSLPTGVAALSETGACIAVQTSSLVSQHLK